MRQKIGFPERSSETFEEVYSSSIISQTSRGVAAVTIRNYHSHLKAISKHLDISMPFCSLSKRHLEQMVVSMREAGLRNLVFNFDPTFIGVCVIPYAGKFSQGAAYKMDRLWE